MPAQVDGNGMRAVDHYMEDVCHFPAVSVPPGEGGTSQDCRKQKHYCHVSAVSRLGSLLQLSQHSLLCAVLNWLT